MTVETRNDIPVVPGAAAGEAEKDDCQMVVSKVEAFYDSIGKDFHAQCEKAFRQWRGFSVWKNEWTQAGPNDRDGLLYDAKKQWGSQLHIPLSFRTIETMIARALANRPHLAVLPRQERYEQNVIPVRLMIDRQQEQIDIELELQDMFRSGAMYGLGAGKAFWDKRYSYERRVKKRLIPFPGQTRHYLGDTERKCVFDDPMFLSLDIWDFGWDPFASSMDNARWAFHRMWMDDEEVLSRISTGLWGTDSAQALTEEMVTGSGSNSKYDEIWQGRMEASKLPSYSSNRKGAQIHEVIEFHDKEQVFVILDRQWLMQQGNASLAGRLPFQIFRPTKIPRQMVGVSELEPIYHLNRELDMLRSQRRDAATLALCAGYAYDSTAIDEEDLIFGPAAAIEVRNQNPRDALMPLQVKEPPGTSYEEERVIKSDIEQITGISDQDSGAQTATESQIVQAAVSERIRFKAKRFSQEAVRPICRAFLALDQMHILEVREEREAQEPTPPGADGETASWSWFEIGPEDLRGEYEVIPDADSMAAPNLAQMRSDSQMWLQLASNPQVDSRYAMRKALAAMSVKDPDAALAKGEPPVPARALEIMQEQGVPAEIIEFAVSEAQQSDPMLAEPSVEDVNKAMAVNQAAVA